MKGTFVSTAALALTSLALTACGTGASRGEQGRTLYEAGNYLAGAQLQPTTMATSVRVRDGKRLVTDGPFAETREQLGGYYLVEAKDLDEAIGLAARIPSAKVGTIEVRPVVEMGQPAATATV